MADIKTIAMIGCGSMGGGMTLLWAEAGVNVELQDPDTETMDNLVKESEKLKTPGKVTRHDSYDSLMKALDKQKVFVWSLPHGNIGDIVLSKMMPYLNKDDIVIDAGNEHWQDTERRMGKCVVRGIRYVGMGVSGGYQAARRGPSMCPGSDPTTLEMVLPLLEKVAAKGPGGKPCVAKIGTGGAGHYVKMLHNGIEHGMMSSVSEAFGIMHRGLGMSLDECSETFGKWNAEGELRGTFLVRISSDICRIKDESGSYVIDQVEDKVVQDFTGEEGTGIWSNLEAVAQHVPAPTLETAHALRLASGDRHQRANILKAFTSKAEHADTKQHHSLYPPQPIKDVKDKAAFLEDLRLATYAGCLLSYLQGFNVISKANKKFHFNVSYPDVLQIWKAGCIIQADYMSEEIFEPIYGKLEVDPEQEINPLYYEIVGKELEKTFKSLKNVVSASVLSDQIVPALSASLEYLKYQTSTDLLPASMYEAQLDYFGCHMYDKKGEDAEGAPEEGKEHFEWKPA
ncbi:6-phosphogluconate dehydrogenase C-terminal domain-like protein [Polychaeton citri CBS 116435]|uniref:phosphogluconate dehydrogenase (NADP(+)-dependent, decarboxylating) n=1 Tax=Polychaeton citri CBS 116435 TaxID=1314669 RepID=A0A9P4UPL2_9PEZI|nr:6-phosphogluconate dehydrogenase C-terminal domain-like protein [Polychaeton citri CBS 116435]